jgi:hypothetical protein
LRTHFPSHFRLRAVTQSANQAAAEINRRKIATHRAADAIIGGLAD